MEDEGADLFLTVSPRAGMQRASLSARPRREASCGVGIRRAHGRGAQNGKLRPSGRARGCEVGCVEFCDFPQVMDWDAASSDDEIGTVRIPVAQFLGARHTGAFPIIKPGSTSKPVKGKTGEAQASSLS